ncbi:MAG: hypothetical protein CMM01_26615 [Rhodopirellula sp.]|nr:hypothetical protein [Rhodopirellula sp.]
MNSNRTKVYVLVILGVILLFRAQTLFNQYILRPISDREAGLKELKQELVVQNRMQERITELRRENNRWVKKSLPKRPGMAATLYQNWLAKSVDSAGFENSQVTPAGVFDQNDVTTQLSYGVIGTTTFEGLRKLLLTLECTPLLHRVTEMQIKKQGNEYDDELNISMNVEALILDSASDREELVSVSEQKKAKAEIGKRISKDSAPASPFLVKRNKPKGDGNKRKKDTASVKAPDPKPVDYSDKVVQIGTILSNTVSEVWVVNEKTNAQSILVEGQEFDFYGVQGTVESIDADGVILKIDGVSYRWNIAESIQQRQKLPKVE